MNNDYKCICGHIFKKHKNGNACSKLKSINPIFPTSTLHYCECAAFKLDNLKYLEMLYEQRL